MTARSFEVCIDAADPDRLRPFWRTALGYVVGQTGEGASDLVDAEGIRPTIWFQQVPEPKDGKNRVHLDIHVQPSERDRLAGELVALGGTVLAVFPRFTTLADPEGNELCLTVHGICSPAGAGG